VLAKKSGKEVLHGKKAKVEILPDFFAKERLGFSVSLALRSGFFVRRS